MTGPGPYPTYTENPYEGGVDQVVPTDAIASSGLAALAAKTQQDWQEELFGAFDTTLNPLTGLLGKVFDLFSEFVDIDGFVEIASDVLGFFYNLLDRAGFFTLLEGGVALFEWLTELGVDAIEALVKPIIELLQWAWNLITDLIDVEGFQAFIQRIVDALSPLFSSTGFADLFVKVIEYFSRIFAFIPGIPLSIADFLSQIPIVSDLVAAITGKSSADGVALTLTTLREWARDIEKNSKGASDAIEELGRRLLSGFLPPPSGGTDINLLSQGDFASLETIDAAGGWSWDNTTTASGSGGSAKLVASGSAQRLYSVQSIPVVTGDVISMSGQVKTSGFTAGTGRSIALSIVPWNGTSRILDGNGNATSVQFTPRTTAAANWVTLSGSYTVPAGVTSIQARLAVTANSGAQIWFDNISIKKKSEVGQDYVNNLISAWRDIYFNATGTAANIFSDAVGAAIGLVRLIGDLAGGAIADTNLVLFNDSDGGETVVVDNLPLEDIGDGVADQVGDLLGVALPTGSGGKMFRAGGTALVTASGGPNAHAFSGFYTNGDSSADITRSTSAGSFTVTHSGYYQVEVGFTVNAVPEIAGAFNVAPAVFVGGSLYKVGAAAFGSYAFGLGGYARSAQSTFIVYLNAGQAVTAGYYNWFAGANGEFFAGGAASTYFSIAMLNRTDEG